MPFTCPRCSRTSHSPDDAREGYCGACRAWTRPLPRGPWQFVPSGPAPPGEFKVGLGATARYIAGRYGAPGDMVALSPLEGLTMEVRGFEVDPNVVSMLITGWTQSGVLIQADSAERQREVDDCPWDDAFTWSGGYTELD